ncbi:MAG: NUDIX domain-containing protein [Methylococcaceae bacterium]|nr:MAG: NUDIX domain-containing protein [Methylococcaceae bacterium]
MNQPESLPHPLQAFRYCAQCGNKGLEIRQTRSIYCPACGFCYFINCAAAVSGFVFYGDQLILTVRAEDPQKGYLDLPGGFVEFDESADDALRREVMEELGLAVTDVSYLASAPNSYLYAGVLYKTTDMFYVCRVDDISRIHAQDDVAGYRLADPHAMDPATLAFPSARGVFGQLLRSIAPCSA